MPDHFIVDKKSLRELLAEEMHSALHDALPDAIEAATRKPYLTKDDLKELTGWSDRQIEYKKSKREIPFIRRGRLILFPTKGIYAYLEEGRVPPRRQK